MRNVSRSLFLLTLSAALPTQAAPLYSLVALPGPDANVFALNNSGVAVGQYWDEAAYSYVAVRWDASGAMTPVAYDGFSVGSLSHISNNGTVVGDGYRSESGWGSYRWSADGVGQRLESYSFAFVYAVNDAGQAVGYDYDEEGSAFRAARWQADGSRQFLDVLGGDLDFAVDINDSGQVTGTVSDASGEGHAVRWEADGALTVLGVGEGRAINRHGVVAGTNGSRAVVWNADGQLQELGSLSGDDGSAVALDINASGQVVGIEFGSGERPFLYDAEAGGMLDFNTLVADLGDFAYLYELASINDQGQVVGYGELKNGEFAAFLATPVSEVPVPAAAWLFGSALLGLWGVRRKAT